MPFLLAEILNFQGSTHRIGVGSFSKLVKEYGLRVYFDKSFNDNNNVWTSQFMENMRSPYCKAVVAFVDNQYYLSYATLL